VARKPTWLDVEKALKLGLCVSVQVLEIIRLIHGGL
jgi:hypothetical protein